MEYNVNKKESIVDYAKRLQGKSIKETNKLYSVFAGERQTYNEEAAESPKEYRGKGRFGNTLEEVYFGKKNDNKPAQDFEEAGLELKASPLITLKKNEVRVKERLVLNHFTYNSIVKETFDESTFVKKNAAILLVFYFYNKNQNPEDQLIDLVEVWECLKQDEAQIKKDWELIAQKVKDGKAEEISEGDTLFLGASTKGATKETSLQVQPYSDVKAPGRALCLKQSYINQIYKILKANSTKCPLMEPRFLQSESDSFEDKINSKFKNHLGKTSKSLCLEFGVEFGTKATFARIARIILGFSPKQSSFYEFDAANIQIKTIRIEKNGAVKESMSFKQIKYTEIVYEDWEDSDFYQELTSKFIFVIFKKQNDDYVLSSVKFWNMPEKDLEEVKEVWEKTKQAIIDDKFDVLPKMKENRISHVRPHAKNKNDTIKTPSGRMEYQRSFWLNRRYIMAVISQK